MSYYEGYTGSIFTTPWYAYLSNEPHALAIYCADRRGNPRDVLDSDLVLLTSTSRLNNIFPNRNPDDRVMVVSFNANNCVLFDSSKSNDFNSANGSTGYNTRRLNNATRFPATEPELAALTASFNFRIESVKKFESYSVGGEPIYMLEDPCNTRNRNLTSYYTTYLTTTTIHILHDSNVAYGAMISKSKTVFKTPQQKYQERLDRCRSRGGG